MFSFFWFSGRNSFGTIRAEAKNWKNNEKQGNGILVYADGSIYEGNVSKNRIRGEGKYTDSQGNVYEGKFKNGTLRIKIDKKTNVSKEYFCFVLSKFNTHCTGNASPSPPVE